MTIDTLDDLFRHELEGMYYVETELVDALDEMSRNATNDRISTGFADHRDETRDHVDRLEYVFANLGEEPRARESPVMDGLASERRQVEENVTDDDLLNLFYLGAGMKTERLEMTSYDSLLTMANRLDLGDDVVEPLEENLDSEEATFRQLQTLSTASDLKSLWERLTG